MAKVRDWREITRSVLLILLCAFAAYRLTLIAAHRVDWLLLTERQVAEGELVHRHESRDWLRRRVEVGIYEFRVGDDTHLAAVLFRDDVAPSTIEIEFASSNPLIHRRAGGESFTAVVWRLFVLHASLLAAILVIGWQARRLWKIFREVPRTSP